MDGEADLIGPGRRRLRIAIVALVVAIAAGVVLLVWQNKRATRAAADRLRVIAGELDRCLIGADGVADDAVYDHLVVRVIGGDRLAYDDCNEAAAAKARDLDADALSGPTADLARSLVSPIPAGWDPLFETCSRVIDVRRSVAAVDGRPTPEVRCMPRKLDASSLDWVDDAYGERLDGDFYDVSIGGGDERTLRRYRPDGGVAAEIDVSDRFATDRDDVVFVTPEHLSRWRGGKRLDGPALPRGFGMVAAWRHTSAGDVGVFWTDGGFRVQTFDEALHPIGASRLVTAPHDADVAIGPAGEVVALDDRVACTTDRTIWSLTLDGHVQAAPIGQPLTGTATFPADQRALSLDCDDAHFYAVTPDEYVACDRTRCAVQRLRHLLSAAVRAHDGGAEVLAQLQLDTATLFVDVRDPHGDGHVTMTPYDGPLGQRPVSYGGRWYVMRAPGS